MALFSNLSNPLNPQILSNFTPIWKLGHKIITDITDYCFLTLSIHLTTSSPNNYRPHFLAKNIELLVVDF